jgi:hypothetical protein
LPKVLKSPFESKAPLKVSLSPEFLTPEYNMDGDIEVSVEEGSKDDLFETLVNINSEGEDELAF